ncbi:phytosulfokine receptor 1-like [Cornus florida]|uniref:phytosulfokine receptor 1-like n=1 Tax=Cornus florida TaxID=4283 RepID=UPI002896A626|nr:phytosulfokine receptor 1-like [Cornus florida]
MSNGFIGYLPPSLTNSPTISSLNLNNNSLNGAIALNCSAMVSLTFLDIGSNQFDGPIPNNLYSCQQLSSLNLAKNILCNQLPDRNLITLILTSNFHDEVMGADSNLQFNNLKTLVVANCQLIGLVPTWLSGCTNLLRSIMEPFEWKNSTMKILHKNSNFSSNGPNSTELQYNQIRSFPPSLDLSNNMLTGPILPEFGNLNILHVLDLRNNNLSVHIPGTSSEMTNLETLDLFYNNLLGSIPSTLVNLSFLSKFSVPYIQLTGIVPTGDQFHTFPDSCFEGNNGMCRSFSSSCSTESPKGPENTAIESPEEAKESIIIVLPFGFGMVAGFVIAVAICFMSGWLLPKQKTRMADAEELLSSGDKEHL